MRRTLSASIVIWIFAAFAATAASAAPITIGSFTWDDQYGLGPSFRIANFSDAPVGDPPPAVVAGPFTAVTLDLVLAAGASCEDAVVAVEATRGPGCRFELAELQPGPSPVELLFANDSSAVRAATLSLAFPGFRIGVPLSIEVDDVGPSGIEERFITVVPEPALLPLFGTGLVLMARRRVGR